MAEKSHDSGKGLVYVGHLPHGFYEEELNGYFSQFGTVTKVKVARNKKTGRCRGFAFVEFECAEVAKIVAQTMNNYLMFNKLLKCQVVDRKRFHPGQLGIGRLVKKTISYARRCRRAQQEHNKCRTVVQHRHRIKRLLQKERRKRRNLQELKLGYSFPGYEASIKESVYAKSACHIVFEEA